MILNEGRPRLVREIEPLVQAIVDILLPGNYGGDALANLLAGNANFSGRLPFTYPRWPDALATYDFKPCQQMGPMEGEYNYDAVMDVQWALRLWFELYTIHLFELQDQMQRIPRRRLSHFFGRRDQYGKSKRERSRDAVVE